VRVTVLVLLFLFIVALVVYFRKKIQHRWRKYKSLWRDLIRILSINVTFAQINSSMTSVIEIQWPAAWHQFVQHFNFVNIDLMSLVGVNCIRDFRFYESFAIMICMPVVVLIMALVSYFYLEASMGFRMKNMTPEEKTTKQQEAFHKLFELADTDHSGEIDPSELRSILHQLGWKLTVESTIALCKDIGVQHNNKGIMVLSEQYFLRIMRHGVLQSALEKKQLKARRSSHATKKNTLTDKNQLVSWLMHRNIVSSSLSGATQLLLLAHTPVSRKVFQYFHCRDVGKKSLLRADYNIECGSDEWLAFLPLVLITLSAFTIALPLVLSFYLIYHRKDLYSTSVHQKIGWLYEPFVRGAEWWQIHDVLLKMGSFFVVIVAAYRSMGGTYCHTYCCFAAAAPIATLLMFFFLLSSFFFSSCTQF
jgi:hypothetical protein